VYARLRYSGRLCMRRPNPGPRAANLGGEEVEGPAARAHGKPSPTRVCLFTPAPILRAEDGLGEPAYTGKQHRTYEDGLGPAPGNPLEESSADSPRGKREKFAHGFSRHSAPWGPASKARLQFQRFPIFISKRPRQSATERRLGRAFSALRPHPQGGGRDTPKPPRGGVFFFCPFSGDPVIFKKRFMGKKPTQGKFLFFFPPSFLLFFFYFFC